MTMCLAQAEDPINTRESDSSKPFLDLHVIGGTNLQANRGDLFLVVPIGTWEQAQRYLELDHKYGRMI